MILKRAATIDDNARPFPRPRMQRRLDLSSPNRSMRSLPHITIACGAISGWHALIGSVGRKTPSERKRPDRLSSSGHGIAASGPRRPSSARRVPNTTFELRPAFSRAYVAPQPAAAFRGNLLLAAPWGREAALGKRRGDDASAGRSGHTFASHASLAALWSRVPGGARTFVAAYRAHPGCGRNHSCNDNPCPSATKSPWSVHPQWAAVKR